MLYFSLFKKKSKREYEFQQLKQKSQEEMSKLTNEINKYKTIVIIVLDLFLSSCNDNNYIISILTKATQKDEELLNVKSNGATLQKELEKLQAKWKNCNDYIKSLPTACEVKQTEKQISDLKSENESLKSELSEHESKYNKAKHL